jgi:hypothetical protein
MLTAEQIAFYHAQGYLHLPQMFTQEEMARIDEEHEFLVREWSVTDPGWTGPWRRAYMDADTEKKSKLTSLHDLHFYAEAWMRVVTHARLVEAIGELIGPNVELHHSTMHSKPPQTGHPFPMHQDNAFYQHADARYVDVLVHLDDTRHANGEIRFLPGSHLQGELPHITETAAGPCTPHLPVAEYPLENTVAVPAKRGDVVLFSIFTVHGSYINTTDRVRRLVRLGYRNPENQQLAGQSLGRPGLMVRGLRPRGANETPLTNEFVA